MYRSPKRSAYLPYRAGARTTATAVWPTCHHCQCNKPGSACTWELSGPAHTNSTARLTNTHRASRLPSPFPARTPRQMWPLQHKSEGAVAPGPFVPYARAPPPRRVCTPRLNRVTRSPGRQAAPPQTLPRRNARAPARQAVGTRRRHHHRRNHQPRRSKPPAACSWRTVLVISHSKKNRKEEINFSPPTSPAQSSPVPPWPGCRGATLTPGCRWVWCPGRAAWAR